MLHMFFKKFCFLTCGEKRMKRKIICIFLLVLLVGTITPYAAVASSIEREIKFITTNSPPDNPVVTCPEEVRRGETFNIKVLTIDPDGDNVYYRVRIGEAYNEWKGPFPSGIEQELMFKFIVPVGTYDLEVQAKDIHDAESDWSSVSISVCRSRAIAGQFLRLFQPHTNIFSLLKTLKSL